MLHLSWRTKDHRSSLAGSVVPLSNLLTALRQTDSRYQSDSRQQYPQHQTIKDILPKPKDPIQLSWLKATSRLHLPSN